jgi:hypothetical protein
MLTLGHKGQADTSAGAYDKSFGDGFIGFGFVLGKTQEGDEVKFGESREFIVGFGGGVKWVKWNGLGIDLYYKSTGYYLAQDSQKVLPSNVQHNAEKISFDNFGGLVFDRFYFGKLYFDGGFYYDWAFVTKHVYWDDYSTPNTNGASSTRTVDRQLVYLNPTNYGLTFRFGSVNGVSLYFNDRLTNVFKSEFNVYYNLPLPQYVLGIVFGVH